MLPWLLIFSVLGLQSCAVSSWDKAHTTQVSEGLQALFGNISQLIEKGKLGLDDVFSMVSRKEWGAEAVGCSSQLIMPVDVLVTHHVPGLECHDQAVCSQRLRELQAYHVHSNSWCDVAYNFLVGDDGRVYEGVGWNVQGSHTQGYGNISLGVAFFGTKEGLSPSPAALSAMKDLVSYAVQRGHLSPRYTQPLVVRGENCLAPPPKARLRHACPSIVARSAWGARETYCPKMTLPAKYVVVLHTAGRTCGVSDECRLLVRDLQSLFMDRRHACDVGYNFLVGQDGAVYEGVGWNVQGSRTPGYNDIALAISFMGTFTGTAPNASALEVAKDLIQCAVVKGYLAPNYLLVGHSDVANTLSPGQALYNIIKTWPHFKQ
ncbi:peptidoglycan recognition protein 4 [Marmota marmota marmota]|uniref:Peptidoglycan recognition protein 4 n=1 Tax=Marmota marmota marmota TaxID=9994 RepID=A0A8C5ZW84_MARMA|nr:peptidoglycan recognition protein 4 [Marmota marmota marmota]XP_015358375.1 peptidoglycan recognition protein 4 [Marmota marmota marmota]XP_048670784.1 peptidoglycan recognition protein 4 [Marmota marmota marmota]XP_048670785.1 peptidoglycan recognition protein 4 [Marmota marmota marmota]